MNSVDWLTVSANVSGLLGSVFLSTPFFRENRLKRIISDLEHAPVRSGGAAETFQKAQKKTQQHLTAWKPTDYKFAVGGIICLGLSYLFNVFIWIITRFSS